MSNSKSFSKGNLWLLAAGFTVLMSVPFLVPRTGFLALTGFVPLLYMDRLIRENNVRHAFLYYFCAFLAFNIATTFWIWFVSPAGAIAALILNALQMSAVFALYRWAGRVARKRIEAPLAAEAVALAFFAITWIAWEHVYFIVEISWPWLCLGNAFATTTSMVQWYEIFGANGGSLWILLSNILIFLALESRTGRVRTSLAAASAAMVLIPVLCSEIRYASFEEEGSEAEVVVVQPNIDPFHKFGVKSQEAIDRRMFSLAESTMTGDTRYIITPETFTYNIPIDNPEGNQFYQRHFDFISTHPGTQMLLGALTTRFYGAGPKPTRSARKRGDGSWVDVFNTAMVIDSAGMHGYYFKSKLVPGVEIIPYENVLTFLGPLVEKFGGSSSSYGTQDEMEAIDCGDGKKLGAMICYESVYGDWSRNATRKGADFLTVITNDGWWGDTPGYRQHFNFARLRAIENRRDVVQAANTGTSGIINQRGDVLCKTPWWQETAFKGTVRLRDGQTPFVRHGDFVGRWASACFIVFLVILLVLQIASVSGRRSARGKSAAGRS